MSTPLTPVSFPRRAAAFLIDFLPIAGGITLIFAYFFGLDELAAKWASNPADTAARNEYLVLMTRVRDFAFTVWIAYCAFADASERQGTLGKKMMGIRVADENGKRLTLQNAFRRNAVKFLSWLPLGLGFLWAIFSKNRRTWHDMLSKTGVYMGPAQRNPSPE